MKHLLISNFILSTYLSVRILLLYPIFPLQRLSHVSCIPLALYNVSVMCTIIMYIYYIEMNLLGTILCIGLSVRDVHAPNTSGNVWMNQVWWEINIKLIINKHIFGGVWRLIKWRGEGYIVNTITYAWIRIE